jgi:hypothetical protein
VHDDICSSALWTMIWDTSIWRRECSNRWKTRSAQKCYPCLRYDLSPMSPGWTLMELVAACNHPNLLVLPFTVRMERIDRLSKAWTHHLPTVPSVRTALHAHIAHERANFRRGWMSIIGRPYGLQILCARLPFFDQIGRAPGKCRAAKLNQEYVCDESRVPAVAVWKEMNECDLW